MIFSLNLAKPIACEPQACLEAEGALKGIRCDRYCLKDGVVKDV
ncbi:MAG: hypothetical protein Q7T23_16510 [Phenylobacterium sp.]|nr:hypothetical protein [Phenylobacterium sp.]